MSLIELFFSPHGRICRKQFWLVHLALLAVQLVLLIVLFVFFGRSAKAAPFIPGLILILWGLVVTYSSGVNQIKRLHDCRYSGWAILISLVPIAGLIWLLVVCGFIKGTKGQNLYGPDPIDGNKESVSADAQKPANKKAIGILLIATSLWFLILIVVKTYYSFNIFYAVFSGQLAKTPAYQVGRLTGAATAYIVSFILLLVAMGWGIKLLKKKA